MWYSLDSLDGLFAVAEWKDFFEADADSFGCVAGATRGTCICTHEHAYSNSLCASLLCIMVPAVQHVDLTGDCNPHALLLQIKAERATIIAKHATALHDLQRLPCFLRLLAQIILQVKAHPAVPSCTASGTKRSFSCHHVCHWHCGMMRGGAAELGWCIRCRWQAARASCTVHMCKYCDSCCCH